MIFLYTALLLLLGVGSFLIKRRVAALEKKYTRVARETEELVRQPAYKDGNSNRHDPYLTAKRQYLLGLLAQKRDRMETRYAAWQEFADKFSRFSQRVRSWKGRLLPYTLGGLDVALVLGLIDYLGAGEYLNARTLVHTVVSYFRG